MLNGNLPTSAQVYNQLASDAQQVRAFEEWAARRYQFWNQNFIAPNNLSTCGIINATDQGNIQAFVGDLNRIVMTCNGSNPGTFTNILYDAVAVQGIGN